MTPRFLHVFPDSPFLSFTVEAFSEAVPGANTFLVHGISGDLNHHRLTDDAPVEAIARDNSGLARIAEAVEDCDIAIFHSVGGFAARALVAAPDRVMTVWSGWGADYYGSVMLPNGGLLGPATARYNNALLSPVGKAVRLRRRVMANRALSAAARAADVFSAPIPEDFQVFRRRFPSFRGRYAQLNYASVDETDSVRSQDVWGDDILLGNSATIQNNHLDMLELLARLRPDGRRVVTPLSYGDSAYADLVAARGKALLGSDFLPLRDFLPASEYREIVARCSTVIMGHRRQQGLGNIIGAMLAGARVFLDTANPAAAFFRERGGRIDTLADLSRSGLPNGLAPEPDREANRRTIYEFWGRDVVLDNIRALADSV